MCAGHYTAYIKNGERWFCYDDAHCYEVSVSDIAVANAYMLFYIRQYVICGSCVNRDVKAMDTNLDRIMPRLEEPFVGKPVKTKLGSISGYISAIRTNESGYRSYEIKCFDSVIRFYLG